MSGLNGFVGISPTVGGVIVTDNATNFNFVPGSIVEINSNPLATGEDDFAPFVGLTGTISDLDTQGSLGLLIEVPNAFTFELESVDTPNITQGLFSSTLSFGGEGTFYDTDGNESFGQLNFSADYAGMTTLEVENLVSTDNNFVASWSLNALATSPNGATDIPDASSMGLFSFVFVIIALFAVNKNKH